MFFVGWSNFIMSRLLRRGLMMHCGSKAQRAHIRDFMMQSVISGQPEKIRGKSLVHLELISRLG